jgi:hypothetical protein
LTFWLLLSYTNLNPVSQARASQYSHLARRLASWGFCVVQYNAPALTIIPDSQELPFLGKVLEWVEQQAAAGSTNPQLQG